MAGNDQPNTPQLRVSDNDRELVLERLRDALSEGRIDAADFDHRAGRALEALTAGDLAEVTADLEVRGPKRKVFGR
jgi:hypothetical protein